MSETGLTVTASDDPEPELRRVSVLFADIQGSTALIQNLDAEEAAGLIDPALHAMIEAAERFGGAVGNRGDGIMAVFGAPSVAEDHGVRACLAALAMRDALASGAHGDVRIRVGINVGDVVFRAVRIGGRWSQDAVGIAVHIAARLEQSAGPGDICISDAVARLTRGFVQTAPLDPIPVKGVDTPIQRYRLLDVDRAANRWAVRAASGLAAFVGRDEELAALNAALHGMQAGPGLRLVQVVGAAGLGKSRLAHEFLRGDAARDHHVVSLFGDPNRRHVPFHPVVTWLHAWLDIRADDSAEEARRKLHRHLANLADAAPREPDLLERLLGLTGPAPEIARLNDVTRVDFGATIAALLAAAAGGRRIVLLCEDVDSFDPASAELLDSTLARLARQDMLVLTTSRNRVRIPVVPPVATRLLTLAPLSDDEATRLLATIDASVAARPALAAEILRKAAGNPLFLEEVAPLIAAAPPAALPPALDDPAPTSIPDRVQALIADRLARLPRPLRRLVQLCAIIGTDVPLRIAAPLAGVEPPELYAMLQQLQAEQLLYESRKYPDPQFSFKHTLTRDVAYRTILAARRRAQHGRIVELLEGTVLETGGEADRQAHVDDLCLHAQRGQLWPQAVHYLRLAANNAAARAAHKAARSCLERARDIAATLPDDDDRAAARLDILMSLLNLVGWTGTYAEITPILDEAESLAVRIRHDRHRTRILARRVHIFNLLGQLDDAIALGEQTSAAARASGDINLQILASFFAGQSYFNAGRLRAAERTLSDTIAVFQTLADDPAAAASDAIQVNTSTRNLRPQLHDTRAMTRAFLGRFPDALDDVAAAHSLAAGSGRIYEQIFAAAVAGFTDLQRRHTAGAETGFRAALALSDANEIEQLRAPSLTGLGHALLMGPDLGAASEHLAAAHRLSRDTGRTMFQISAATGLALGGLRLNEPDLARGFAEEAAQLAERFGFEAFRVHALRARGLVLATTTGPQSEGPALLHEAVQLAHALDMQAEIAHGHMALAAILPDQRASHLSEAERRYAALGMHAWFESCRQAIVAGRLPYL